MIKIRNWKLNIKNHNWGKLVLELAVVFLGVTAGLILNNWNLQRQEIEKENKYLQGFLKDVNKNIIELENYLKSDSLWFNDANSILKTLGNKNIQIDSARVAIDLILKIKKIKIHTDTYENIINSDNLSIISNFNLKNQIINYHKTIKSVDLFDDFFYNYYNDYIMPVIFSEYNVLNGTFNDPDIIKTTKFSNAFVFYYSMMQQQKEAYTELLAKSCKLRDKLERYKLNN